MNRTLSVFLCTMLLLAAGIQGQLTSRKGRCMCLSKVPNAIPLKRLERLEIHPKSSSCNKVEIIVTHKKTGDQICLDPDSKAVQKMLKNYRRSVRMLEEKKKRVTGDKSPQ